MARPLRVQYPGALYHVTCRGNERKDIYQDDADRKLFLQILSQSLPIYTIKLYSYVLMSNHFHLLLETPRGTSPNSCATSISPTPGISTVATDGVAISTRADTEASSEKEKGSALAPPRTPKPSKGRVFGAQEAKRTQEGPHFPLTLLRLLV